jgi:hypothetical protein
VDRCALFVDAGYVLADGAMAVHGTRRSESVSWDHAGLLQLLSSLARERSGLPLLRCYWYEASVDGRRTAEHDALADLPGIKLRLAKIRPGRREGVETEIHRDLTTLARNNAISDALVVSAEEDLAQVIADVQDLGMRVTLVHIAVDGNWTISRTLRQESDDLIEIGGEHLRPYVELIAGAEPARTAEEPDGTAVAARSNGHLAGVGSSYQQVPAASGNHSPPAIYTAPVVAEYQRPALQLPRALPREERPAADRSREDRTREDRSREDRSREDRAREDRAREDRARDERVREDRAREERVREERARDDRDRPVVTAVPVEQAPDPVPAAPAQLRRLPSRGPSREARETREAREPREPIPLQAAPQHSVPPHSSGLHGAPQLSSPQLSSPQLSPPQPNTPQLSPPQIGAAPQTGTPSARSAPYSGPQPVMSASSGYPAQPAGPAVSLADAVQAAHEEGQDFGESVARDAPALWLEAVLARKPRMPSDLEARLLQGSALPIDFLLHDEVRHALRRGFWDALERTRR